MKRLGYILALSLVLILAALLVLVFSASSWLETASGRNLIQRELGKSLNLLAVLEGDYEFKIFPQIQISGHQLKLHESAESRAFVEMTSYELHLALWPLLQKQIMIHKIEVHDASLDLDLLTVLSEGKESTETSSPQLPRIQAMEISGLRLLKSANEFLLISRLSLQDFAANQDSRFSLKLEMPSTDGKHDAISLAGHININAAPLEVTLGVDELMLDLNGQSWPLGSGQLAWSNERNEFTGQLRGELVGFNTEYDFSLLTADQLRLNLAVNLQSASTGQLSAQLLAHDRSGTWAIDSVELDLDGQQLNGTGCLNMASDTRLQLELFADHLDVDALQNLLPANLLVADPSNASANTNWPLQLAIALQVEQATLSGAIARDVQLLLGDEPDCGPSSNTMKVD